MEIISRHPSRHARYYTIIKENGKYGLLYQWILNDELRDSYILLEPEFDSMSIYNSNQELEEFYKDEIEKIYRLHRGIFESNIPILKIDGKCSMLNENKIYYKNEFDNIIKLCIDYYACFQENQLTIISDNGRLVKIADNINFTKDNSPTMESILNHIRTSNEKLYLDLMKLINKDGDEYTVDYYLFGAIGWDDHNFTHERRKVKMDNNFNINLNNVPL